MQFALVGSPVNQFECQLRSSDIFWIDVLQTFSTKHTTPPRQPYQRRVAGLGHLQSGREKIVVSSADCTARVVIARTDCFTETSRAEENHLEFQSFDFALIEDEMAQLDALNRG